MNNVPNGNIPPIIKLAAGLTYQGMLGMCFFILLILIGFLIISLLYPKNPPKNTSGT